MAIVYGRVPKPAIVDKQGTTAGKPAGRGWDNLGKHNFKGFALHRMWGTLAGTDSHFGNPSVGALTDYGLGSANIDGAALDGRIHQYNDPYGYRSPWASGPVSAPYGDGLAYVKEGSKVYSDPGGPEGLAVVLAVSLAGMGIIMFGPRAA